jgi:2-C-methyl-D-erythritol 4-phosphate cytidylyltransferase/2-C-methyl-D-erythritol 2,4-cyclodiphosphate synthase|tara:strand:+ start:1505 stop:2644 length:1140 start_codon:yes stop_codon:yes gene_type:complete
MKNVAIILGAGSGKRFGSYKQVEVINNKTVYSYSLDAFIDTNLFSEIFLVVPKKIINLIKKQLDQPKYKDVIVCEGGNSRAKSVHNAFSKITQKNKKIFIHDAVRPLINKQLIIDLVKFSKNKKATVLAKKINETVRSVKKEKSQFTVDRSSLWTAETPQVFDSTVMQEMYKDRISVIHEYTDEAAIVEDCGISVDIYENKSINTKITTKEDLKMVTTLLTKDVFYGLGLDFHSLESGNGIIVGGVKVPCNVKTVAHSDGDVLTHAIIDALCGALNLGDIGTHFPNTPEFKNVSSLKLLKKIVSLIPEEVSIVHLDATIVLENPKISSIKDKIASNLAGLLNVKSEQISIKGITRNGLNFLDMKDGWGAEVIISLKKWN